MLKCEYERHRFKCNGIFTHVFFTYFYVFNLATFCPRNITLWPWPLIPWPWAFVVDRVSRAHTLYKIWAKWWNRTLRDWVIDHLVNFPTFSPPVRVKIRLERGGRNCLRPVVSRTSQPLTVLLASHHCMRWEIRSIFPASLRRGNFARDSSHRSTPNMGRI